MYQELQHKTQVSGKTFPKPPVTGRDKAKWIFWVLLAMVVIYFAWNIITLPRVADIERFVPAGSVQIYDRYDKYVCAVENGEAREPIKFAEIPKHVRQALLAIEDRHFYEHDGVNVMSIGRAALANVKAGKVVEGGSTITQQLAKNLFLDGSDRSLTRKVKEAALALQLEHNYPKDRILELYLNQVYFGRRSYGIQRAARAYFNKKVPDLNLAESAFLAGLVKAPSTLGDPANLRSALERQREVLSAMVESGFISDTQAKAAATQKLRFQKGTTPVQQHPYFVSCILSRLRPEFGKRVDNEGLRIYTSMDPVAQRAAEKALAAGIGRAPAGVSQGALVSISVADGGVLALVGGVGDFYQAQFNRATAPHTMGSSVKPFVYLSAFQHKVVSPNTEILDEPLRVALPDGQVYEPKNFDNKYMGQLQVRQALAFSRNTCAVRIAQATGIGRIIETAKNCGLSAKLDPHLSLALGASAASPLDMAGAYGTFARGGKVIEPWMIRRVENSDGNVIKTFSTASWTGIDDGAVTQLLACMQDAVKYGTGQLAKLGNRPVAAKTGTADQAKDLWFIGTTPDVVTAVWGGNDDNLPIAGQATGGTVMSSIWKDYMTHYYAAWPTPPGKFPTSGGAFDFIFKMVQPVAKPPDDAAAKDEKAQEEETNDATLLAPAEGENGNAPVEEVDPSQYNQAPMQFNGSTPIPQQVDEYGRPTVPEMPPTAPDYTNGAPHPVNSGDHEGFGMGSPANHTCGNNAGSGEASAGASGSAGSGGNGGGVGTGVQDSASAAHNAAPVSAAPAQAPAPTAPAPAANTVPAPQPPQADFAPADMRSN